MSKVKTDSWPHSKTKSEWTFPVTGRRESLTDNEINQHALFLRPKANNKVSWSSPAEESFDICPWSPPARLLLWIHTRTKPARLKCETSADGCEKVYRQTILGRSERSGLGTHVFPCASPSDSSLWRSSQRATNWCVFVLLLLLPSCRCASGVAGDFLTRQLQLQLQTAQPDCAAPGPGSHGDHHTETTGWRPPDGDHRTETSGPPAAHAPCVRAAEASGRAWRRVGSREQGERGRSVDLQLLLPPPDSSLRTAPSFPHCLPPCFLFFLSFLCSWSLNIKT